MIRYKASGSDKLFNFINFSFLLLIVIMVLYPILYIVSCSFSSSNAVLSGKVWLYPVQFSLLGYKTIFQYKAVWTGYGNTIIYTVFGTAINILLTILAAYPLSRKDFKARNIVMFLITFTMMFSGGLIPTYLLISNLGMINTIWSMVLPGAVSAWNVIITRTFYQVSIPDELHEAAQLDGCGDIKFMFRVVLPLSGVITAVNALFYAVGHWNSYFDALLYLSKESLYPLQIILRKILILNSVDGKMVLNIDTYTSKIGIKELLKYSLIIVSSIPVFCIYPFIQKYFVKGVMIGSLKG